MSDSPTAPLPHPYIRCPASGWDPVNKRFNATCRDIVTTPECACPKYINIKGTDKNTGKEIDVWGCIDSHLHRLVIENSYHQFATHQAIESFRNAMADAQERGINVLAGALSLAPSVRKQDPKLIKG